MGKLKIPKANAGSVATYLALIRNQRALELWVRQYELDKTEITALYDALGIDRKFIASLALGNTVVTYTGWSHVTAFGGYSLWKFAVSNFSDNSGNILYVQNLDDDIHLMLPQILEYQGAASSELASYFDYIYYYNGASYSANYGGAAGDLSSDWATSQQVLADTDEFLYVGDAAQFEGVTFSFQTYGVAVTLKAEYWNGAWTELDADVNSLVDNTNDLTTSAKITWQTPADEVTTTVNSQSAYWIRFSTTTIPSQAPSPYAVLPEDSVVTLLRLGADQIRNEEWAWCYFSNYVYVTIPNSGNGSYEGKTWINSNSSAANLKNFFVYRQNFYVRYLDSTWPAAVSSRSGSSTFNGGMSANVAVNSTNTGFKVTPASPSGGRTITHNLGHTNYRVFIIPTAEIDAAFAFYIEKAADTFTVKCPNNVSSAFDYRIEVF